MPDILFRRWHLKLLSLALAFAVWVAVTGEGRGVGDVRVPVDVQLADGATLSGTPPATVTVRLRGSEALIRRIDPYDLDVRVDLRDAAAGERTVQLTPRNVRGVPRDLEIAAIDPDRLKLVVARKKRRAISIVPTIVGKPPRGYVVYGASARPSDLEVEGPDAKLGALTRLRTDPIHVEDRREPFTARVGAIPDGTDIRVVDARPLDVTVVVDLAPVDGLIERVPVVVPGGGGTPSQAWIDVTVSAPSGLIPRLRDKRARAVAELPAVPSGELVRDVPLRVEFPGLSDEERSKVTVKKMGRRTVDVRPARR